MIEFRTLGAVALARPDGNEVRAVLERPKLLGLLSFLAASTPRGFHRRDALLTLFWPEVDQERARRALRQSLYYLRQSLGEGIVIGRGEEEVALSDELFWSDVVAFGEALGRGERERALELYRGEFLNGFFVSAAPQFEQWLDQRRTELREQAARAAWELAEVGLRDRNPTVAAQWGRRAVRHAPFDERLLRRTIKLLDRVGDRAGAVREYDAFARRLEDELELAPSPETQALIEEVRARIQTPPDRVTASHPPESPGGRNRGADPDAGATTGRASPFSGRAGDADVDRLGRALAGRYAIERRLDAGGMSTVYLARDLRHDRPVAIKVMHPDLAATLGAERFLREIKIVANLAHPHIVPLFDSGVADALLFHVMPYVTGESLQHRIDRDGRLPLHDAITIACEVADALEHAHGLDVVHRDIKPANILLSGGHALVADFGVARAVSAAADLKLTAVGAPVGTPTYMSPEQASGSDEIDGRSDIYSLGCVLYEMLAGKPPFTAATVEQLVGHHRSTPPASLSFLRPSVPTGVAAVIGRALRKAPADRFASAAEFAAALKAASSGATPAWPDRWRRLRVGAVGAAAIAVFGVVLTLVLSSRGQDLDPNRVVVAPFENRTGDAELGVLGNMAADWITEGLEQIGVVEVVSSVTNMGSATEPTEAEGRTMADAALAVARAEGAGTVVIGAVYQTGESLEFQAQVVDAGTGRLLRAVEPVAGPLRAPGDVVDTLRQRVVGTLARMRDPRLASSNPTGRPPSLEAYRQYLEGYRNFYGLNATSYPLGQREALQYLYRAVELDSSFLDPRFLIVWAHWNLGEPEAADSNARLLIPHRPRLSAYERHALDWILAGLRGDRMGALEAARAFGGPINIGVEAVRSNRLHEAIEAFQSTDLSREYFAWLSFLDALHMWGDYGRELREARQARQHYPDRLRALIAEVRALAATGRVEDVKRRLDESLLFPVEENVFAVGAMMVAVAELRRHGHRDAAFDVGERANAWFQARPAYEHRFPQYRAGLAESYYLVERWDEAQHLFEGLAEDDPRNVNYQGYLGVLAARRGDREGALRISERLLGMNGRYDFGRDLYWQACIVAQLGELDRAMALLREAYARGRIFAPGLHRDIDLEPLHDSPGFQAFIAPKR